MVCYMQRHYKDWHGRYFLDTHFPILTGEYVENMIRVSLGKRVGGGVWAKWFMWGADATSARTKSNTIFHPNEHCVNATFSIGMEGIPISNDDYGPEYNTFIIHWYTFRNLEESIKAGGFMPYFQGDKLYVSRYHLDRIIGKVD